jgi:hypothetical protein
MVVLGLPEVLPTADSFSAAIATRKQSMLNLREINISNTDIISM